MYIPKFTIETEEKGKLAFLDTCVVTTDMGFRFKVYRKPTNRENYVHFYLAHSDRIKTSIVIGFFLRAFRISDKEYLDDEINHIFEAFQKLMYPKGFLIKQNQKAERIKKRNSENVDDGSRSRKKTPKRWITMPNFKKKAEVVSQTLEKSGIKVATNTGVKIQDVLGSQRRKSELSENKSVVYKIPCNGWYKTYLCRGNR